MKLTEQELKYIINSYVVFLHNDLYETFYKEITKYGMEIDNLIKGVKEYYNNKINNLKELYKLLIKDFGQNRISILEDINFYNRLKDNIINYLNFIKNETTFRELEDTKNDN